MNKQLDIAVKALKVIGGNGSEANAWTLMRVARNALRDIEAITSSNETSATCDVEMTAGEGYRLVEGHERLQEGDECWIGRWAKTSFPGTLAGESDLPITYRRKLAPEPIVELGPHVDRDFFPEGAFESEPKVGTWLDGRPNLWTCGCTPFAQMNVNGRPELQCNQCGYLRPPLPVEAAEPESDLPLWAKKAMDEIWHLPDGHKAVAIMREHFKSGESPTQTEQVPSSEQVELGGGDSPCGDDVKYFDLATGEEVSADQILTSAKVLVDHAHRIAALEQAIGALFANGGKGSPSEQAITPEPEATRSVPLPEQELEQASSVSQNEEEHTLKSAWLEYIEKPYTVNAFELCRAFQAGWNAKAKASKSETSANSASAVKTEEESKR